MEKERCFKAVVNKNNLSFPRNVVGNLPLSELFIKEDKQLYFNGKVEDPRQKHSGMTPGFNNNGFTLIELLVVVLIIGILASVALPQYKLAVAKARVSTLLGMMNAVKQAQETYYLANGSYANDINELSVSLPGKPYPPLPNRVVYSPNAWTLDINNSTAGVKGQDDRVSGVQIYFFHDHISHEWKGKHLCYARMSNDFANKICQNLTNRKTPNSNNGPGTDNIYIFK